MRRTVLLFWLLSALAVGAKPYQPQVEPIEVPPMVQPPPVQAPSDVPNRPLSADEAARIALHYQSNVEVARAQADAAEGRTDQVRSNLRPRLNLGSSYTDVLIVPNALGQLLGGVGGLTGGSAPTSAVPTTSATSSTQTNQLLNALTGATGNSATFSATVRQLIFDFNHTRELVRQDQELERAAYHGLTRVQYDLVYTVKQAFYNFAQTARVIHVNVDNVANRRVHLRQAQSRFKGGLGLPADITRAQTALAEAVGNLTQAQADSSVARVNLNVQMGLNPRTPIEVDDKKLDIPIDNPEQLFETALKQRPDVLQAVANVRADDHAVSAASTTSAPDLSANLGYTGRAQTGYPLTNFLTLVFSISFDAYDGGLEAGKVKEAKANRRAARAQLEGIAQGVISDVSQAYVNLRTAHQKLQTTRIQEENAQETVRLAEGRYKVGLGIFLDIIDAQSALLSAQIDRVNAQTSLNLARAALAHALGNPLPH